MTLKTATQTAAQSVLKSKLLLGAGVIAAALLALAALAYPAAKRREQVQPGTVVQNQNPVESGSQAPLVPPVPPAENIRLTNTKVIAHGAYPTWSPDGKWIVFGKGLKGGGLFIMDAEGKNPPKEIGSPYASSFGAVWTADSREIFYRERIRIQPPPYFKSTFQSVDIYNGKITPHSELDGKFYSLDELPILIQATKPSDPILYFQHPERVDKTLGFVWARTKDGRKNWLVTPKKGGYWNLRLSPDKTKLLLQEGDMFIYATDGTGLLQDLGEGSSPTWSPDGKVILFDYGTSDGHVTLTSDLYVVNADGTGRKQITFALDILEWVPQWSPDGKHVLFGDLKTGAIYTADVETDS